jgi:hypothetical protein
MGLSMGGEEHKVFDGEKTFGARARELIDSCPDIMIPKYKDRGVLNLRKKVLTSFLSFNKEVLKKQFRPWFIPERLGGVGLPCVGSYRPSELELRMSRKIHENYELPMIPLVKSWPLWSLAVESTPKPQLSSIIRNFEDTTGPDLEGSSYISYKELLCLSCIDILLSNAYIYTSEVVTYSHYDITREYIADDGKVSTWVDKFVDFEGVIPENSVPSKRSWILSDLGIKLRTAKLRSSDILKKIQRIWRKALSSEIPMPQPYSQNPLVEEGYDYPLEYDVHEQPSVKLLMNDPENLTLQHNMEFRTTQIQPLKNREVSESLEDYVVFGKF